MEGSDPDGGSSEWMDPVVGDRKMKKRFNEDQVRSLESMFETEMKLDPRKKQQLARELGLHPRQVAIWFQNKRARWKSKQLEREYGSLKADYDALLSTFKSLDKEKQALTKQLQALNERVGERDKKRRKDVDLNNGCGCKEERKPKDHLSSDGDMNLIGNLIELYGDRQTAGDLSTAAEQEFRLQTSWPSDQSSQWWDFWPVNEF